jgi:hypothetical protein
LERGVRPIGFDFLHQSANRASAFGDAACGYLQRWRGIRADKILLHSLSSSSALPGCSACQIPASLQLTKIGFARA